MEIVKDFVGNQLVSYIPVVFVIVVVVLVFAFGFKRPEQPPFDKLTNDDRKQAGKKKKIKEKKTSVNGHVTTGDSRTEKSPAKDTKRSPAKEPSDPQKPKEKKVDNKQLEKNKKNEVIKSKVIEDAKNKKNLKKLLNEKPVDFDDGNWETVIKKADKKKKPDQSPTKKDKKAAKKNDKAAEIEKLVKEVVNQELREKIKGEAPVEEAVKIEEPAVIIEEKKEKKKEKKVKKEEEEKPPAPPVQKQKEEEKPREDSPEPAQPAPTDGGVAFDELGDVWKEAKLPKKSKKKSRRDN